MADTAVENAGLQKWMAPLLPLISIIVEEVADTRSTLSNFSHLLL
jgi:hypothetical protein